MFTSQSPFSPVVGPAAGDRPPPDPPDAAPGGWRRWMPWLTGAYFAGLFALASLTTDPDVEDDASSLLFIGILLPLLAVMVWYCFRRARPSLVHGLIGVGLGLVTIVGEKALDQGNWFTAVLFGCMSAAGWYAATGILDRYRGLVPGWSGGLRRIGRLVGLGLVVGLVLGVINLVVAVTQVLAVDGGISLGVQSASETVRAFVAALRPGIWEEVAFHFFPLAWWVAARGALPATRWGMVGMFAWLILPHAAIHVPDLILVDPVRALGSEILLTSVVFGLPLVWLNVRRGVVAAITAHWAIDAMRFALGWW